MSRKLDDLSSEFRPLAFEVLARLAERQTLVMIVDTLRTEAEHQANLAAGTSSAPRSKHLPRTLRGWSPQHPDAQKSDAIDLVPFDIWQASGPDKISWDTKHPTFAVIGEIGESLGLRWGGRWKKPHDPGHLEFVFAP